MPRKRIRAVSRSTDKAKVAYDDTNTSTTQTGKQEAGTAPSSGSNVDSPTPPESEHRANTTFYGWVRSLALRGRKYLFTQLGGAITSLVLMLLGFKNPPQSIPLFNFANEHRIATPIIGAVFLLLSGMGLIISFLPEPKLSSDGKGSNRNTRRYIQPWRLATLFSTTSFVFSSILLLIVFFRPPGCPPWLCRPPLACQNGVHDDNLEICFTALQSAMYVIPGDPARYSQDTLPKENVSAWRIDGGPSSFPYGVVLKVHSLQQERSGMLIEQVALVVEQVSPVPHPLNVWTQGPTEEYQTNLHQVVYWGQKAGEILSSVYYLPFRHVSLAPGETDQLTVQVSSRVAADLRFRLQVRYRITNEAQLSPPLTLPQVFEIVFSNTANWHEYQLQEGRFIPIHERR